MGVIKIETFDVNVTATASQTHTLTNTVPSLNSAFVRRTTSIDKQSGPTTSTANANANVACGAAFLSSTSQISFRQNTTTSQKIVGEVWRYTGAAAGPDEFIVRGRHTITLAGGAATGSTAVSGITNVDKCIPFWTGSTFTGTSVNDYDSATVSVYIDGSGNIQVERGATTGTLVVYVTVVEFTGSNWSIGHGRSLSHDSVTETITLNTASTATGGSTFDVGDWTNAMIVEGSLEGDTAETGLSDNLGVWVPGTTTQASFILQQDGNARNDGGAYCHVLVHPSLIINRDNNTNIAEGNGTYANITSFPTGSSTTESLDELSLEWFCDTSGVGTAHARGRLSAYIDDPTGNITHWVHRSGNNVRADWGVAEVGAIDGTIKVVLDSVDADNVITNTQTNVVILASGGGLGAVQGTGKVELVQNSDYTGTIIAQSIDSWADGSIQFDVSAGALADSFAYVFVTTDSGEVGSLLVQIGNPPETYQEAQEALSPAFQHYWPFQNSYADEVGTATANNASGGTPTFSTTPIVKGDTHSLLLNGTTEYISAPDQTDMNTSSIATRRMMSGWIMLDRITQAVSVIWEEGAQVNNYAWLVGFGNNLMIQFADDGGDYVQVYFPVSLTPNRPYHVYMEFNASGQNSGICRGFLDGVPNVESNGNPWTVGTFPSHSGNISWGHEGSEFLQVGDSRGVDNVDIAFATPVACHYAHFISMQQNEYTDEQIRVEMFEKGAIATETVGDGLGTAITDSYAESNQSTTVSFDDGSSAAQPYQTFTGDGGTLGEIRAMLGVAQSAGYDVDVYFEIYAHTGTFGSTGEPTGAVLATSEVRTTFGDLTATVQMESFVFSGDDQITLDDGVNYCLVARGGAFNGLITPVWGADNTSPTHPGNSGHNDKIGNDWDASRDLIFEVRTLQTIQEQIDDLSGTTLVDAPCAIEVAAGTDGDFELILDDITFEDRVSIQVRYMGSDTLTLVTRNGTTLDTDKLSTPYGGTIVVVPEVTAQFAVKDLDGNPVVGARVYVRATAGGSEVADTVLLNDVTDGSGIASFPFRYSIDQPITARIRKASSAPYFKSSSAVGTITASGFSTNVFLISDE